MALIKSIDMTPEVYWRESEEFQVFLNTIDQAFSETFDKTERITDNLDPLQVQENIIPLLAHRLGFVYDWRFQPQFNRLVLYHFPSMIYNRGSRTGITIGALTNLASLGLDSKDATSDREFEYFHYNWRDDYSRGVTAIDKDTGNITFNGTDNGADPKLTVRSDAVNFEAEMRARAITEDRLDETALPNNAVSVSVNTDAFMRDSHGRVRFVRNEPYYINVVYFSETVPVDACLEYVRPLGLYLFQQAGVKLSANNRVLLHPTLGDQFDNNIPTPNGSQRINPREKFSPSIYGGIGDYNRADFTTLQQYAARPYRSFDPQNMILPSGIDGRGSLQNLNPQAPTVPWNDGTDERFPTSWTDPANPPRTDPTNHPLYQSPDSAGFQQWLADNATNIAQEIGWDDEGKPIYGGLDDISVFGNEKAIRTNDLNNTPTGGGSSGLASTDESGRNVAISVRSTEAIFKRIFPTPQGILIPNHRKKQFWSRNNTGFVDAETTPLVNPALPHQPNPLQDNYNPVAPIYDAGYNTLYSFQLSNNEHIIQRLMPKVFELGYLPTHTRNSEITVEWMYDEKQERIRMFNLQYADGMLTSENIPNSNEVPTALDETAAMKPNLLKGKIRFGDILDGTITDGTITDALSTVGNWAVAPGVNPTLENVPNVDIENQQVGMWGRGQNVSRDQQIPTGNEE
jgi:hypothetical protein